MLITESNFFDFFSFKLISGNAKTALREPNSVVLTEKTARKYFGDENPMEKLIIIGEGDYKLTYKVTGIAADCPSNSHFGFNALLSPEPDSYPKLNAWLHSGVYTYFLLRENTSVSDVENKLENIVAKYVAPDLQHFLGNSVDQFRKAGGVYRYYTTRITDIHLKSTSQEDIELGGSMMYIYVFGGIGIFIMAIT